MDNVTQGWVLATASGFACVLGASVVFTDVLLSKVFCMRYIRVMHNKAFLVASLSLASGIMIYSSFNMLLPEAQKHFTLSKHFSKYTRMTALAFYFIGVLVSALVTRIVNNVMEHALEEKHIVGTSDINVVVQSAGNERTPLIAKLPGDSELDVGSPRGAYGNSHSVCVAEPHDGNSATSDDCVHHHHHHGDIYGRKEDDPYNFHDHHHHHYHFEHLFHPREDSTDDRKQMMRIGIQTAIAISIHKFPEGLIMFITSQASQSLGFAFFFAIALHNISEGFAIALPLYMATQSRVKSFLYASVLGGMSQPFGALLGWLFVGSLRQWDHHALYGMIFSCVSGLMSLISIQGMLPQAMKNDSSNGQTVTVFFFIGILVMGVSQALVDLHK